VLKRSFFSLSTSGFSDSRILVQFFNFLFLFIIILFLILPIAIFKFPNEITITGGLSLIFLFTAAVTCLLGRWAAIQSSLYKRDLQALRNQIFHDHKLVSVGQLAGGVAHEINNPLAIIASETGLIKDMLNPETGLENSPEAIIKELDEIEKATYRAKNITGKILSFVKKREPQTVPCHVEQLIEDVMSGFVEQEFKVSNITVQRDFAKNIPLLMLDPDMMRQVFLNLINNAKDAVSEGGMIRLKTCVQDDYLKITISDTGPGIAEEEIDKLFMPFYTTKKAGSGTGLGLSISLKIIEEFGGTIDVNSSKGKGSDFIIFLPISKLNIQ